MKLSEAYLKRLEDAKQEGIQKRMTEVAATLLRDGIALEAIVRWTGLSIAEIEQIRSVLRSEE